MERVESHGYYIEDSEMICGGTFEAEDPAKLNIGLEFTMHDKKWTVMGINGRVIEFQRRYIKKMAYWRPDITHVSWK